MTQLNKSKLEENMFEIKKLFWRPKKKG